MRVFEGMRFTFHHFLTSLIGWVRMVYVIANGHIGYSVMYLIILGGFGVQSGPHRSLLFIPVHYLLPQVGWMKLNTDSMAQGASSKAVDEGVFEFTGRLSLELIVLM